MKFLTLRRKHAHQRRELHKLPRITLESLGEASGLPHQAHSYSELRQQIHDDLRIQHPEWIQANGECPMCDAYEARLLELLAPPVPQAHSGTIVDPDPMLGHGRN